MAIPQLKVRVGGRGKGVRHSNYVMREDKFGDKPGKHANGIDREVEHTSFGNMPSWINNDPKNFWKVGDEHERKNGTSYREHIISLPRELNLEQRIELTEMWIKKKLGAKHAYQYAMHNPPAADGGANPHVHLMFCERMNDGIERSPDQYFKRYNAKFPERGGSKKASFAQTWTERKNDLKALRHEWQEMCNDYLAEKGIKASIDMRNWKERGLSQKPLNISMTDMQNPVIKAEYVEKLNLRKQLFSEIDQIVITNNLIKQADQDKAKILAAEQADQERAAAAKVLAERNQKFKEEFDYIFSRANQSDLSIFRKMGSVLRERYPTADNQNDVVDGVSLGFGRLDDQFRITADGRFGVNVGTYSKRFEYYNTHDVLEIKDNRLYYKNTDRSYALGDLGYKVDTIRQSLENSKNPPVQQQTQPQPQGQQPQPRQESGPSPF